MRDFLRSERGSVLPLYAMSIGIIAVLVSAILTHGLQYLEDRRMQALADLIALVSVRDQNYSSAYALQIIEDQGLVREHYAPILTPGHYIPDPGLPPYQRFEAGARPFNAVRVDLHAQITDDWGHLRIAGLLAEAAAARRDTASFAVGSRLARLEGGASGEILGALIGHDGRITAMDYRSLADIRIDSLTFLNAVAGETGVHTGTYEEILDANVPPRSILRAVHAAAGRDAPGILGRIAERALRRGTPVRVGDILEASAIAPAPLLDGMLGAHVSALDIIEATAYAANSEHQVAIDLDAHFAAVSLAIGERPQSPPVEAASLPGARAETRQLDLLTQLSVGLSRINIRLEAAMAEAELTRVSCGPGGRVSADFDVTTNPARLVVETGGALEQALSVDLGTGDRRRVTMTERHIASGQPETLRSGAGVNAGLGGTSLPLGPLTGPILREVDNLAGDLGLHLAEADLFLRGASCGHAFLIE
jgi:uncharacterized membrane protein